MEILDKLVKKLNLDIKKLSVTVIILLVIVIVETFALVLSHSETQVFAGPGEVTKASPTFTLTPDCIITNTPTAISKATLTTVPKKTLVDLSLCTPTPTLTATEIATFTSTALATDTLEPTLTSVFTDTQEPTNTLTPTNTATATRTVTRTSTITPTRTLSSGGIAPYPNAPLCPDVGTAHEGTLFHTIWDSTRGCHYDHEHGVSPFTSQVANTFPGFNLSALLCGNEVSHCNPSSEMENTHKHGGNKWQIDLAAPHGCETGFESGTVAVDAYAIQHHNLGRQDIELETSTHSSVAMLRQCKSTNPSDKGYIFVGQLQEYGQRVMPYQGFVLPYPNNFQPQYASARGQYFTTECFGDGTAFGVACRSTYNSSTNNLSIWTSKVTGAGSRPPGSSLFTLLFRIRDVYMRLDASDMSHPFTWLFVCGGNTFNPAGCRYNNSTTTVHEVAGRIPASWDNLAGFDTNPTVGRITAEGFVTRYGNRNTSCVAAGGLDCQPIKMINAFVGFYSSELSAAKVSNPTPLDTPEQDIYFCGNLVCSETSPGARPSGWIGDSN